MTKQEFINERTRIISEMLDNPDKCGIYPTTKCFTQLDELYDKTIAIAEHEASKWKKYPENVPDDHKEYLVQRIRPIAASRDVLFIQSRYDKGVGWAAIINNHVIAFRELPEPYKPE